MSVARIGSNSRAAALAVLSELSTNRIIACQAEGYPRIGVSVPYCPKSRLLIIISAHRVLITGTRAV